ncbi:MAG: sulfatase/phosphatase domain-containing protein, partial [Kiritimatiellales bacterium]
LPLIIRWPKGGAPAGQVNTQTVIGGVDLLPTICELAGAQIPSEDQNALRGQSVVPALKGDKTFCRTKPLMWERRFRVLGHTWNRSPILAIRDGEWKLLMNPDRSRLELYDMNNDPEEQNNIAVGHEDIVSQLSEQALAWEKTLPVGPMQDDAGKNDYPWPSENKLAEIQPKDKAAQEEALSVRGPLFVKLDKNQDHIISEDEFLIHFSRDLQDGKKRFSRFDSDGNGQLSRSEFVYGWRQQPSGQAE